MELIPFWFEGLAQASYLLVDGPDGIVVDPALEAEWYVAAARERGAEIRHILETHVHADFVSGHLELAGMTGATIWMGPGANPGFPAETLADGLEIPFGTRIVRALTTPGHTPCSVSFVVPPPARARGPEPSLVLTGDTLFVGDVGRPDLAATASVTVRDMAHALYESLRSKLLTLPDETLVYPAHGAGSLCGKSLGSARSTTIGAERMTNPALVGGDEEAFVRYVTTDLPPQPVYFARAAAINRRGPLRRDAFAAGLVALTPAQVQTALPAGAVVLDTRDEDVFPHGHIPGAISIAMAENLGAWAGTILPPGAPVILLCASGDESKITLELQRVAWDPPAGYLQGGFEAWARAGLPVATLAEMPLRDLASRMAPGSRDPIRLLDVRSESEFSAGHVPGALNVPLTQLPRRLPELDPAGALALVCSSGFRSVIAASLLLRHGFRDVRNIAGGFGGMEPATAFSDARAAD